MTAPITPDDVVSAKQEAIPSEVIEVFNQLIAIAWDGHQAVVHQSHVAEKLRDRLDIEQPEQVRRGYHDIEEIYRKAGWDVDYDKPGYNESYPATYTFKKPGK